MVLGNPGDRGYLAGATGSRKASDPPNLAEYLDEPQYDLATIVQLVGVRPMILWGWEQQLGIPAPVRVNEDASNSGGRRYSERDLIASLWLRDQIVNGVSPNDAAARLFAAQQGPRDGAEPVEREGARQSVLSSPFVRARVNTSPLRESAFAPQRAPKPTRRLADLDTTSAPASFAATPSFVPPAAPSLPPMRAELSGPLGSAGYGATPSGVYGVPQAAPLSGPLAGPVALGAARTGQLSDPLRAGAVGGLAPAEYASAEGAAGMPWFGPGSSNTRIRELRALVPQLIRAFANFDTFAVNHIVNEALAMRSVETVCISLLQPTLTRVSDQWAHHELTIPEVQFAFNYVRGLLYSIFHGTPERFDAPLVFVGCGPREMNDIGALTLALFWRRAGLRVAYLGQDTESDSLVEEVRQRRPALLALSITTPQRVRSLARLTKRVGQLESQRPIITFSGPVFARNPELQRKVTGVYLGDDPATATWHVTRLLGIDRVAPASM